MCASNEGFVTLGADAAPPSARTAALDTSVSETEPTKLPLLTARVAQGALQDAGERAAARRAFSS